MVLLVEQAHWDVDCLKPRVVGVFWQILYF
jgi:hypothetical protein